MKTHVSIHHGQGRKQGFALVCVLLLMMLLAMLGLGLLSLSSISLRGSQAGVAREEARANARLGLMLAIAELQKHAGADQRVTARADIMEPAGNSAALKQPWLTGVWRTEDNPLSDKLGRDLHLRRPQKFPAYLVSGNERFDLSSAGGQANGYPTGYLTPDQSLPAGGADRPGDVVVGHCSRAGSEQVVRAPLMAVKTANSTQGGYAYWVEDEGVKARLDLRHPYDEPSDKVGALAGGALGHRNRVDWVTKGAGSSNPPGATLASLPKGGDDPVYGKLASMETVALAGNDPMACREDLKRLRSDLTTSSRSLLVDMQRGGFRRDLTAAFRQGDLQGMIDKKVFDSELIFPQQGTPADGETGRPLTWRPGGVPWSVLQDYVNYGKRISSGSQVMDVRDWLGKVPTLGANQSPNITGRELGAVSQFYPVLNRAQMFFDVSYQEVGAGTYDVMFHLFPMIVLWNPYDQPMRVPPFRVNLMANKNASTGWYELTFGYQLKGTYSFVGSPGSSTVTFRPLCFFSSKPIEIPAGKSIILTTPKKHIPFNTSNAGQELVPEWQDGFGLYTKAATVAFAPASPPSIQVTRTDSDGDSATNNNYGSETRLLSNELGIHVAGLAWDIDDAADAAGAFIPQIRPAAAPLMGPSTPRWGAVMARKLIENQLQPLASPTEANGYPAKGLAGYNLRAHHYSYVGDAASTPPQFVTGTLRAGTDVSSYLKPQLTNPSAAGPHYTFVGGSDLGGADRCVLFHVPRDSEPVLSLAQFSHAALVRPFDYNAEAHRGSSGGEDLEPTYPIGNSVRPPHHPADQLRAYTVAKWDWSVNYHGVPKEVGYIYRADTSFLYNNALWDTYYLSGYEQDKGRFLNARLKWGHEDRESKAAMNDPLAALSKVYLDGGFNVNSTSKAAWKALLASTVGIRNTADGKAADLPGYNRIPQADTAFRSIDGGMTATSADPYLQDARMLDERSLDLLAEHLVEQVKLRGPFPTLAAFVNRSIDPASHGRSGLTADQVCNQGALQAALDGKKSDGSEDVNQSISRSDWVKPGDLSPSVKLYGSSETGHVYPEAAAGARGFGAPLYLMPSDILAKIGPFLTVRSDTFRIQTYGEARDSAGKLLASARCEAIVQREPQWVGGGLEPTAKPAAGSMEERFGRTFRVVSFRWMTSDEI
ncbi:hypothetical protein [Luteolibacter sp. LG18]|uniref:hypothetical protein n=1 Tax=Luteolibacter sp. LG18 TaxID=2819286 RepID=UPI002B29B688|nr:hypothetical protein llg_44240 [Luteolibacter sp. LG18]